MPGPADTLEVVRGMLVDVIGPEYLIGLDIELETSFDADLELESLEFVAMAERLLQHYGEQVDFVAWLATMELDDIIGLTVSDLVTFIDTSTSGSTPTADAETVTADNVTTVEVRDTEEAGTLFGAEIHEDPVEDGGAEIHEDPDERGAVDLHEDPVEDGAVEPGTASSWAVG